MSISGLFTKIYRDIIKDQVELIRIPDVMVRLRKALSDQNMTLDTLAYLLNIANSPAYRTRAKAADIQSAIRMMGIPTFSNLITAYAVRSMITSKNETTLKFLKAHWQRSATERQSRRSSKPSIGRCSA